MQRKVNLNGLGRSVMLLLGLAMIATTACGQEELVTSFITGKPKGNLALRDMKDAEFEKEGEQYHLAVRPGGSIQVTFDTRGHWGDVVLEMLARTTGPVVYAISVNDEDVQNQVEFSFDVYTSTGHNISRKIISGKNTAKLTLLPMSKGDLWLREVRLDVGTRRPLPPWGLLLILLFLIYVAGRWVVFRLLWMGGRGIDAVWATRISIIFMAVGAFLSYLYAYGPLAGTAITVGVGGGILIVMLIILAFTRA